MYMTMIAQALAIAVVLYGMDFLVKKRYWIFALLVLLATTIHGSAIICLAFIPLTIIKINKKNIALVTVLAITCVVMYEYILSFALRYIVPGYSFYLDTKWGKGAGVTELNIIFILFYACILLLSYIGVLSQKRADLPSIRIDKRRKKLVEIPQLSLYFLVYMTLISLLSRFLLFRMAVIERIAYYTYLFAHTLLCSLLTKMFRAKNRFLIKLCVYVILAILFLLYAPRVGATSYRVVPYEFFWQ